MKTVQKMPSIHIPIQKPDGSMEWVWYMFLQWLSEHLEDTDLSDYFTKEETNALLSAYYTKTETDDILSGYAIDSNVVHKTGTETITGAKTFTSSSTKLAAGTTFTKQGGQPSIEGGEFHFEKGDSDTTISDYVVEDLYSGKVRFFGTCNKSGGGTEIRNPLTVDFTNNRINTPSIYLNNIPQSDTGTSSHLVPTIGWVNNTTAGVNNIVHKNGSETITGIKTFTENMYSKNVSYALFDNTDSSKYINFLDKNGRSSGWVESRINHDSTIGESVLRLFAQTWTDNTFVTTKSANIDIVVKPDGTMYATGPTPTEDTTTSRQIDTVGARNTKLQNYQPLLTAGTGINIDANNVISSTASGYHPDLFDTKWSDHIVNDIQWLRGDTFSWQNGTVYQAAYDHLVDDIDGKTLQSETVEGTTIQFYLADDGHKICPASEESNVAAIYATTGVAWYYIIDTTNQRFKLPRRHSQQIVRSVKNVDGSWYRLYADGWVEQGGYVVTSSDVQKTVSLLVQMDSVYYDVQIQREYASSPGATNANLTAMCVWSLTTTGFKCWDKYGTSIGIHWQVSGQSAIDMSSFQDGKKYLYFYVGNFTQTAIENTAGLNAELFNGKLDTATFISNTLSVAASDIVNSVLTTVDIRKQGTGHVKLGNGIIIQWGGEAGTGTRRQQILSTAFTTNNYFVNVIFAGSVSTALYLPCIDPLTMTTTTFDVITNRNANNVGFRWIAIGW